VTQGEREGVQANIADMGLEGALDYSLKRLAAGESDPRIKRLMALTVREAGSQLRDKIQRSYRLLEAHWPLFTPETCRKMRDETGCGLMECKHALTQHAGDYEKAKEYLRTKGYA
jgi:hypothetical protein